MTNVTKLFAVALIACSSIPAATGQRTEQELPRGPIEVLEPPPDAGIAWFGTWAAARAEAKRTGRPILFMSAAPQCKGTPGVW